MKREDLARLARNQTRIAVVVLAFVLGGFALSMTGILARTLPSGLPQFAFPAFAALVAIVIVGFAMMRVIEVPRCPHCKRLLTGYLLRIAIASGNCGYCSKSVED
jgi:hypothetical protein